MYKDTKQLALIAAAGTFVAVVLGIAASMIATFSSDAMHMAFRVDAACDWKQDSYYCDATDTASKYMDGSYWPEAIILTILVVAALVSGLIAGYSIGDLIKIAYRNINANREHRQYVAIIREEAMISRLTIAGDALDDSRARMAWLVKDLQELR